MSGKKTAVFGIYPTLSSADHATDTLVRAGFPASDISALLPENLGSRQIATERATKAPEGAATGAGSGAVLGGALGLLAGIGALAIPGVGPLIAAGPIMAALAGLGVGGAVGGGYRDHRHGRDRGDERRLGRRPGEPAAPLTRAAVVRRCRLLVAAG